MPKLRLVLAIFLVLVALTAFGYGIYSALSSEDGWTTIEVSSDASLNNGDEFVFQYLLGSNSGSATADAKLVTSLYTDAMVSAWQIFNNDTFTVDVRGVYYINQHPNEVIEVDPMLYKAFELCAAYDNRTIYLAPVYKQYDSIFYCNDDWETASFDPRQNETLAADFLDIAAFARDPEAVEVQLLGNNQIRLYVSEAYQAYAGENDITSFIDFYWMKNAFIADYAADVLIENGYTHGTLSSYDGFIRNLDDSGDSYALNIFNRDGNTVTQAALMTYSGRKSIVCLRDYSMNSLDFQHYYQLEDGQIRSAYLDVTDGLCKAAVPELYAWSESESCAELLMQMIPCYIADSFDVSLLPEHAIYCQDRVIYASDDDIQLSELAEGYEAVSEE